MMDNSTLIGEDHQKILAFINETYLQNCPNYITVVKPFFTTNSWLKKCRHFLVKSFFFLELLTIYLWIFFQSQHQIRVSKSKFSFPKVRFKSQNKIPMISLELVQVGWAMTRSYKKTISNYKFIRGRFQTRIFFKLNILQVVSKCPYGS